MEQAASTPCHICWAKRSLCRFARIALMLVLNNNNSNKYFSSVGIFIKEILYWWDVLIATPGAPLPPPLLSLSSCHHYRHYRRRHHYRHYRRRHRHYRGRHRHYLRRHRHYHCRYHHHYRRRHLNIIPATVIGSYIIWSWYAVETSQLVVGYFPDCILCCFECSFVIPSSQIMKSRSFQVSFVLNCLTVYCHQLWLWTTTLLLMLSDKSHDPLLWQIKVSLLWKKLSVCLLTALNRSFICVCWLELFPLFIACHVFASQFVLV